MAALESPFDGLLSCSSVFVRPNPNIAPDRYGQQHTDDQYNHLKGADNSHEGGSGHDVGEEHPAWRWAGPTDTGDGEEDDDLLVDPERELAAYAGQPHQHQHQHRQSQSQGNGSPTSPERLDLGYGSRDIGEEDRSWVRGASDGNLTDGDDDDNVVQHGAPSPVVGAVASSSPPPSTLRSFEDQPIRGLARVKEMSLDELIAQGERQMQESQTKTAALAKLRRIPPGGGVGYSRPNSPPISAAGASPSPAAVNRQNSSGFDNGDGNMERDSSSSSTFANGGGSRTAQPPVRRGNAEMRGDPPIGTPPSHRGNGNINVRSSAASHLAWGDRSGSGGGGGGGLRASLRSGASFATSWSGGDPDQLRHLSMGVMPAAAAAAAAGTGDKREEEETREEREQREFHELEMELLREEERGRGEGAVEGQRYHDGGWDRGEAGESYALEAGGGGSGDAPDGSEERNLGWEHPAMGSDNANHAAADRYRTLSDNIGVENSGLAGGFTPSSPRLDARHADTGNTAVRVREESNGFLPSDRGGESAWQEDERSTGQQPGYNKDIDRDGNADPRQGHGADRTGGLVRSEDDEDTRGWEAEEDAGGHGHDWPVQERDEWGRTTMRRDGNTHRAPQHAQQQEHLSVGNGADALETVFPPRGQRQPRVVHTPPPSPPPGAPAADNPQAYGSSGSTTTVGQKDDEQGEDAFGDEEAWGDLDTAGAGAGSSAVSASTRNGSSGHQQGFPNGSGVVGTGVPRSKKPPSALVPPTAQAKAPKGAPTQSKLVQKVFGGGRGKRGGGRGGLRAAAGRGRGKAVVGQGVGEEEGGPGAGGSWAVQAELQGKLRELEEEVARYKEENERARLARRKQETALSEVMRKRQEVREWAEAERAAVEAWCTEQRQASAREKRAAVKQVQGLRARALAGGGLGNGTATERRQRQEIEGLKATIERQKLDAETAKKKARSSERRLQQQIKAGAERVAELEGQVSFLERQRVQVWASATGGSLNASAGAGRAAKTSVAAPGLSRSMNGGSVGVRRSSSNGVGRLTRGVSGQPDGSLAVSDSGERNPRGGVANARYKAGHADVQGRGGRGQEVFSEEMPTEDAPAAATREDWERDNRAGANFHQEKTARFAEGGVTPGRRSQGGGGGHYVGNGTSSAHADGNGELATRRHEDGPQGLQGWGTEADGGYDGRWSEQEKEDGGDMNGGQHAGFQSGGSGVPWRTDRGGSLRDRNGVGGPRPGGIPLGHDDDAAEPPPLDGFRGTSREREGQRFREEQQPGRGEDWHRGNAPVTSQRTQDDFVEESRGGEEAFVDGHAGYGEGYDGINTNDNGSNDKALRPPLEPSRDARPQAASSDGIKYDPLRYKMPAAAGAASSQNAHGSSGGAVERSEVSTRTGSHYPNPVDAAGSMRRSSSNGNQSTAAAAAAAAAVGMSSLGRSSAMRHSDGAGMVRAGGGGHQRSRSREVVAGGAAAAGGNADGDADDDGGVHKRSGEGSGEGGGAAQPEDWRDPNDGLEEEHGHRRADTPPPAITYDGGRSSKLPERDLYQAAAGGTQTGSVVGSPREGGRYSNGGGDRAGTVYRSAAGVVDGEGQARAAAGGGLGGSAGAGKRNGGKVEHVLRDGRRVILFANGTQKEMLPDGGCVVRFVNGDLKRVEGGTGVVVYTYAAAQTTHTMHPSGLEVFEFPSGQVERHHKTGEKEIDFPDGTRKYILPSGREMSEFPDGVTVVEYPEGHRDVTSPNGTTHRERPDGTVETPPQARPRSDGFASREVNAGAGAAGGGRIHPKLLAPAGRASRGGW